MKKLLFGFLLGLATGAGGYWYIERTQHKDPLQYASEQIKGEVAHTSKVVREKARDASGAITEAAANARTTATIKAKLIKEPGLSAFNINVDTTDGLVTLSGTVNSPEEIAKAFRLARETDGVTNVFSTLQIKTAK